MDSVYHVPIMATEISQMLQIKPDGVYFDGTLGGGGHSEMILSNLQTGTLIATDKDDDALAFASKRLEKFGERFKCYKSDYLYGAEVIKQAGYSCVDGILLDLGVSSFQLDNFERGFSYRGDNFPLDMRMDKSIDFSAYDVVNAYSEKELVKIFKEYGEERFSLRIAQKICTERKNAPIKTTGELVSIIRSCVPQSLGAKEGHPAKRVFQAIRIEVNGEIANLENALKALVEKLSVGSRICVLTFHSLEDRIVKNLFKYLEADCVCDKSIPICVCGKKKEGKIITKKPVLATPEEQKLNSRAIPAKLRVLEKV
ncbi:MAG: 16S rRNA (cytosine(1402)-N(4))-methyltransferase RsmH [Bacillota bacterium]